MSDECGECIEKQEIIDHLVASIEKHWKDAPTVPCICPGCPARVVVWSASGTCAPCFAEDCDHDDEPMRPTGSSEEK